MGAIKNIGIILALPILALTGNLGGNSGHTAGLAAGMALVAAAIIGIIELVVIGAALSIAFL